MNKTYKQLINKATVPYKHQFDYLLLFLLGYKSDIYPDVTSLFDAAAIKYILTLIPSGLYQRY